MRLKTGLAHQLGGGTDQHSEEWISNAKFREGRNGIIVVYKEALRVYR